MIKHKHKDWYKRAGLVSLIDAVDDNRGKTVTRAPDTYPWWSMGEQIWWNSDSEDWWYSDETADFCGPFKTQEEAQKELAEYVQNVLG